MGNCCIYSQPKDRRKRKQLYQPSQHSEISSQVVPHNTSQTRLQQQPSASNLQHISEREPEDMLTDPSNNPLVKTIFYERSKSEINRNSKMRRKSHYDFTHQKVDYGALTKKYSSCSTIFIDDSTVSQPNLKNTIKAVALAVYFHIKSRTKLVQNHYVVDHLEIFDETLHPLTKEILPNDFALRDPEHKTIYRFVRTLFSAAQLTAECAIVTLVYLERLLTSAEMELSPSNWKRIVLGAILLASKVWDDQAVWNVDYCQILKDLTVEDMNELERQFLEMLQFNINVPSSVYAKYYFDLRALADANDLSFPLEPLNKDRALKLEALCNVCEDKLRAWTKSDIKRSTSLDALTIIPRVGQAILS